MKRRNLIRSAHFCQVRWKWKVQYHSYRIQVSEVWWDSLTLVNKSINGRHVEERSAVFSDFCHSENPIHGGRKNCADQPRRQNCERWTYIWAIGNRFWWRRFWRRDWFSATMPVTEGWDVEMSRCRDVERRVEPGSAMTLEFGFFRFKSGLLRKKVGYLNFIWLMLIKFSLIQRRKLAKNAKFDLGVRNLTQK